MYIYGNAPVVGVRSAHTLADWWVRVCARLWVMISARCTLAILLVTGGIGRHMIIYNGTIFVESSNIETTVFAKLTSNDWVFPYDSGIACTR